MRIVVAHESPIQRHRLQTRLSSVAALDLVQTVAQLCEIYDYAEHYQPNCILMSGQLANCPEFEILDALFRILGIGCVLLQEPQDSTNAYLTTKAKQHVIRIASDASDTDLFDALNRASTHSGQHCTSSMQATTGQAFDTRKVILIGSSTGGVDALLKVISFFPANCPPTMIVQHTGGTYAQSLIKLLDGGTAAQVVEASDGMALSSGKIYLAPGDAAHLQIHHGKRRAATLVPGPPISGHRPSVDALFRSAVSQAQHVNAAILTGMGRDGAEGITELSKAGAHTIGQDEATSVVYGMPRVAMELGGINTQLAINRIGPALLAASKVGIR